MLKKIISMFVAIGIIFIVGSSFNVSHAYEKTGYKLSTKNQSFKWGDRLLGSSVIKSGWQDAISSWQNSAANAKFFYHGSSVHTLNSWYESSSTYYGRMSVQLNNKIVTKFSGDINAGNTNITKSNVAKSTAVHELGHALGLDHNTGTSIMNSDRDRTKMHVPQKDDVNGVNAIYK